jgi:hypothetical protein
VAQGGVILTSRIPEIVAGAEERGHAVVDKTVHDIEAAAKARLYAYPAVESAALVNSGEAVAEGFEGEVGFGTGHSNYVEFGTGGRGEASHFLGKPDDITYSQDWAGMAAQPYLIPSVEEAREPFEMACGQLYG